MKKLTVSFVRDCFNKVMRGEISFSKAVELLNEETGLLFKARNKLGILLITQEKDEQINKHQRLIKDDVKYNSDGELIMAAVTLLDANPFLDDFPNHWDKELCLKMSKKPHKERLVIAGALIAAEIDRLNFKG